MKVLFITTVDPSGNSGQNIATKEIIASFGRNKELLTDLICPSPENEKVLEYLNIDKGYFLPAKSNNRLRWQVSIQYSLIKNMFKSLCSNRPDFIVSRMTLSLAPPIIAYIYKVPYYLLVRGQDGLYLRDNLGRFGSIMYLYWKLVFWINIKKAKQIFVAYNEIKQEVNKYCKQDKCVVFANAVNPYLFKPLSIVKARQYIDMKLKEEDFVIGYVGSLQRRHNANKLLYALREVENDKSNIKVLIVGDGPELMNLRQIVSENNMADKVIFTGFVPHDKINFYMSACDILYGVVDRKIVSNPIKCYEYLAAERPVITSEKEEFKFINEHRFGVTIKSPDISNIKKAILYLYNLSYEERQKMGEAGRSYVLNNHTWDTLPELMVNNEIEASKV